MQIKDDPEQEQKLNQLRTLYEPYAQGVARNLLITLPPWIHPEKRKDNWQAGPWDRAIQARSLASLIIGQKQKLPRARVDEHF